MSYSVPHPARSAEFLSRLHDGELTAAERAQFESHRAHCAECRNTAFEFESALSLYRSSRPRPPAPDLSARILRKLQQSNRQRRPLGFSLGIDLRWAGAFAAAVIAAIIGFSVVARQEASRRLAAPDAAIPITLKQGIGENEAPKPAAGAPSRPAPPVFQARRDETLAKEAKTDNLRSEPSNAPQQLPSTNAAPGPPMAERKEPAARDKSASDAREAVGGRVNASPPESAAAGRASALGADRPRGEGAVSFAPDSEAPLTLPLRLVITAADGGLSPELVGEEKLDLPAAERGREYSLVIDSQGRVSDVKPVEKRRQKTAMSQDAQPKKLEAAQGTEPPQALRELRFRPSDRPRLLRVRIE
jgi:hypothetical protein